MTLGPELPSNNKYKDFCSFFFNVSGNEDPSNVHLMVFTENVSKNRNMELLMLNKNKNGWESTFINHNKMVFPYDNKSLSLCGNVLWYINWR